MIGVFEEIWFELLVRIADMTNREGCLQRLLRSCMGKGR